YSAWPHSFWIFSASNPVSNGQHLGSGSLGANSLHSPLLVSGRPEPSAAPGSGWLGASSDAYRSSLSRTTRGSSASVTAAPDGLRPAAASLSGVGALAGQPTSRLGAV